MSIPKFGFDNLGHVIPLAERMVTAVENIASAASVLVDRAQECGEQHDDGRAVMACIRPIGHIKRHCSDEGVSWS